MPDAAADHAGGDIDFASLLELEQSGDLRYRGWCHEGAPMRGFGGHLAAQAFIAAARTAPSSQVPASMHAYFVAAAGTQEPIDYQVSLIRDGGSLCTRSVTALQRGRPVFALLASFQRPEESPRRQRPAGAPTAPPAGVTDGSRPDRGSVRDRAIEQQQLAVPGDGEPGVGYHQRWMRARLPIGDDLILQAGAVIYMADMVLTRAALQPHLEQSQGAARSTSLDHSVWFHDTIRAERWLLLAATSPVLAGSRALAFAHVYGESGQMVASAAQDVLARQLGG